MDFDRSIKYALVESLSYSVGIVGGKGACTLALGAESGIGVSCTMLQACRAASVKVKRNSEINSGSRYTKGQVRLLKGPDPWDNSISPTALVMNKAAS